MTIDFSGSEFSESIPSIPPQGFPSGNSWGELADVSHLKTRAANWPPEICHRRESIELNQISPQLRSSPTLPFNIYRRQCHQHEFAE